MLEGLCLLAASVPDAVLKTTARLARYDFSRDVVRFQRKNSGGLVNCAVPRGAGGPFPMVSNKDGRVERSSRTGPGSRTLVAPIPHGAGRGAQRRSGQDWRRRGFSVRGAPQRKQGLRRHPALDADRPDMPSPPTWLVTNCPARSSTGRQGTSANSWDLSIRTNPPLFSVSIRRHSYLHVVIRSRFSSGGEHPAALSQRVVEGARTI